MRIIHIVPYFPPDIGGIETYVYELTKRLSRYCDVEVFTCGGGFIEEVAGVVVHHLRAIDIKGYAVSFEDTLSDSADSAVPCSHVRCRYNSCAWARLLHDF